MSEELKTLKDMQNNEEETFRICCCGSTKESHGLNYIDEDKLKQEAIKCFKKLEKLKESRYFDKRDSFQNNFQENPVVVLRFIEWFFNITTEDLKNE